MTSALDNLAAGASILPEYTDKMGVVHVTPPETGRQFLAAMGFAVGNDAEISASEQAFEDAAWTRLCPPVLVVRVSALPATIAVSVPADAVGYLQFRLEEESGCRHEGRMPVRHLPVAGQRVVDGRTYCRHELSLPICPQEGYHHIRFEFAGQSAEMSFIVVPDRCFLPEWLGNEKPARIWGIPCQLYALRSRRNWGIGDFTDLAGLIHVAAGAGASFIGINPISALFPEDPENAAPYCSSSRLFLNHLYIDAEHVPDFAECAEAQALVASPGFQERLAELRAADWIDYPKVAAAKMPVFEMLFASFRARHLDPQKGVSGRGRAFEIFCEEGGLHLRRFAAYQALSWQLGGGKPTSGWHEWPAVWRDSRSDAVHALLSDARVAFFMYLHWQASGQLAEAAAACHKEGMAIGLYPDQAVGVAAESAETWADPHLFVPGLFIGAPPDLRRPRGQNWGLAPMIPHRLKEAAYKPFRDIVRCNMRHAGALRIDHIMGLMRQFWTPFLAPKEKVVKGAYVGYPFEDLIGIVALESQRRKCIVIGEDLGTVPPGFRERMREAGILGTKVLYRQCAEEGAFFESGRYPALVGVAIGNHDQPTLHGWWDGHDLALFERHGLFLSEAGRDAAVARRRRERQRLVELFDAEKAWPDGQAFAPRLAEEHLSGQKQPPGLLEAAMTFLARTPSAVVMLQLEDVLEQREQVNLPGTVREYPNWRRRLPVNLEDVAKHPMFRTLAGILSGERPAVI